MHVTNRRNEIKQSLVYDKHGSQVIGFVDLGSFNEQLADLEGREGDSGHAPVATHMLALMIRGMFLTLNFPYAHFPTEKLKADQLFVIIWEAVERLERLGFEGHCHYRGWSIHESEIFPDAWTLN